MHLVNFLNSDTLKLYPSLKKLSRSSGCDVKQIIRALDELEEKKFITKLRIVGKVNHYRFTDNFLQKIGIKEKLSAVNLTVGKTPVHEVTLCQKILSFCQNLVSKSQPNMVQHGFNKESFFKKNLSGSNQKEFLEQQKKADKKMRDETEKRRIEREKWKLEAVPPPPDFFNKKAGSK